MTLDEQFAGLVYTLGGVERDEGDVLLKAMREVGIEIVDTSDHHHYIQFDDGYWTILHPITERLDGSLFDCSAQWDEDDVGRRGRYFLIYESEYENWALGERIEVS